MKNHGTSRDKNFPPKAQPTLITETQASREARAPVVSITIRCPTATQASREARVTVDQPWYARKKSQETHPVETAVNVIQASREARMQTVSPQCETLQKFNPQSYLSALLLSRANDIESNPGPIEDDACQKCKINVNWSSLAIQCDGCDKWSHKNCIDISNNEFQRLEDNSTIWLCKSCGLRNIHSSFFNSKENMSPTSLSFDSFNSPGKPLYSSSPIRQNRPDQPKVQLRIINVNCQSVLAKRHQLAHLLDSTSPDVVIGTESWLNSEISNNSVFPTDRYTVFRRDRGSRGGGVFILIENSIHATCEENLNTNCEILWCKIHLQRQKQLYIGAYYRPQELDEDSLLQLELSVNRLQDTNSIIILGGDFNTPGWDWVNNRPKPTCRNHEIYEKLNNIIDDSGMQQMITKPTRNNNTLDLIITNYPSRISNPDTIPGISDHHIATVSVNVLPLRRQQTPRQIPQYGKANWSEMTTELTKLKTTMEQIEDNVNPEALWNLFKNEMHTIIKKFIPHKKAKKIQKLPYITKEIERLIRKRNRKYQQMKEKQRNLEQSTEEYIQLETDIKNLKKEIQQKMRRSYWDYMDKIIDPDLPENNQLDSMKRFWHFIKVNKKDSHGVPRLKKDGQISISSKDKANSLNRQFQSVFSPQPDSLPEDLLGKSTHPSATDINITTHGIFKMLKKLKPYKAAGPDNITARVLKELAQPIAPILKMIFQASYDTGILPQEWREANVVPVFKKGAQSDPANYRPISLTCISCKLMEHIVASNIMAHARSNNILYKLQHGFLDKRSCETQLIEFQNDILQNLNNNQQTDVLIMDFAKAFDKVSHMHLIKKLDYYGVRGKSNRWIKSFLSDRQQQVLLEGEHSDKVPVTSGVPQGSVLGPCLFIYYINDIANNMTSTIRLFADDTVAYLAIKGKKDADKLQEDLNKLGEWEKKWQMEFHPQKCEVLSITKNRTIQHHTYKLHGQELQHVNRAKYLGVTITSDMSWNTHITNIISKASKNLGFLKRNLQSNVPSVKERAYKALVRPILEYAPTVWDPYTLENINRVEMIQRRAARYVLNQYGRRSSVNAMLKELKWPLLETRRKVSRLCMLYKATNKLVELPSQEIQLKSNTRSSLRINNSKAFNIPDTPKHYIKESFYPKTIREWNILPEKIVTADTIESFRNLVMKHFYK